jgi:4-amino-4-deoxy-L-arabinose transferase-like glycosyltransferase
MIKTAGHRWDQETMLVAWLAACLSLISFFFYLRHGDVLLYGDAVAHIGIARRVFDSRTPGILQLGTVWLPLPHLLMIPFLLSDRMWQTGVGGSIPSLVAFVFGAVGIFRLVRGTLASPGPEDRAARIAAWSAAMIYMLNPNLLYLQATAMTEPLYLALFIWVVVYFGEWVRGEEGNSALVKCGVGLAAASLVRYDGWFLAAVVGLAALIVEWRKSGKAVIFQRRFVAFALLVVLAPVLWVAYNAAIYRNPLEFANGPYSAKAIEKKTAVPGFPPHPGTSNLHVAGAYFLRAGELTMAAGNWGRLWLLLALVGTAAAVFGKKLRFAGQSVHAGCWLLLWTPLPFYALSIAYGGVPIFLPGWWPDSIYNARYGLQLLPVFAVFAAITGYCGARFARNWKAKAAIAGAMALLLVASYAWTWGSRAISFREAWINSRTRLALEQELAAYLKALPPRSNVLIYLGNHVGALQRAGMPLRRTINEGNHRVWKQPVDPEGLWERALADPARYADYVIAIEGDPVSRQVNRKELVTLAVIHVSGQPTAVIYQSRREEARGN